MSCYQSEGMDKSGPINQVNVEKCSDVLTKQESG